MNTSTITVRELALLRGLTHEMHRQAIECPTIAGRQALEEYAEGLEQRLQILELAIYDGKTYEQFLRHAAQVERQRNDGRHLHAV